MKTRITELLGTRYPIVQGGMQWVGTAELASAVSNAGALGILTALTQPDPDALRAEIRRCRTMTDKPFGVNLTILPKIDPVPYDEYLRAALEEGIKVIETAGRSPEPYMDMIKAAGAKVIHKCTSVRHSVKAEKVGCDAVSVDGFECAGHPGEDDVPNLVLIPAAAEQLSIPIIASRRHRQWRADGGGVRAGRRGINMGTRFMATREAPIHENLKQAIVRGDERQTALVFRTLNNTARIFRNAVAEQVLEIESREGKTEFRDLQPLVAGTRGRDRAIREGEVDGGVWTAGMVMGLIHDVPSCAELIERIIAEARSAARERVGLLLD
ncbi:MAG: nitronate monooxygenase family protein [Burkholderiaceae bacterium]